jgi:arsenic resistance protein ArsH
VFKNQIDWLPLEDGSVRPTQGRTLAVMQVSGGSQSFNTVNTLRVLGRWMRMLTIPNQSSVAKAWQEFDDDGRMKPSPYYDRVVDVMEELVKFTLLTRGRSDYLVDRTASARAAHAAAWRGRRGCGFHRRDYLLARRAPFSSSSFASPRLCANSGNVFAIESLSGRM